MYMVQNVNSSCTTSLDVLLATPGRRTPLQTAIDPKNSHFSPDNFGIPSVTSRNTFGFNLALCAFLSDRTRESRTSPPFHLATLVTVS